jgi:hypothetical protein
MALGLLLGLAMQHRLDPATVPDTLVIAGLRQLLGLPAANDAVAVTPAKRKKPARTRS